VCTYYRLGTSYGAWCLQPNTWGVVSQWSYPSVVDGHGGKDPSCKWQPQIQYVRNRDNRAVFAARGGVCVRQHDVTNHVAVLAVVGEDVKVEARIHPTQMRARGLCCGAHPNIARHVIGPGVQSHCNSITTPAAWSDSIRLRNSRDHTRT
jgi:hypothetical protein